MRDLSRDRVVRVAAVLLVAVGLGAPAEAQTTVYYLPSEYPEVCAWDLTNGGPACDGATVNRSARFCMAGLTGLDVAREALGLPTCPEESESVSIPGIDYVMLVDDRQLSPRLSGLFGDAVRDLGSGPLIYPTRTADSVTPRGLVVGERLYRDRARSRTEWLVWVASLLGLETGARDLPVEYSADYDVFRAAVEDLLCPIMLCRSDGRERMRTLIDRVEEQLREVHRTAAGAPRGLAIIRVMIYRQPERDGRIERLGFAPGEEIDFGDDEAPVPSPERTDPEPVVQDTVDDMTTTAGPRPERPSGEAGAQVAMEHMAHLDGYAVTMAWLTEPTTPMDDEALPVRSPTHPSGCGAAPLQERNHEGCEAALEHWGGLTAGQRRLLRTTENRERLLRDLNSEYCEQHHRFYPRTSCEGPLPRFRE